MPRRSLLAREKINKKKKQRQAMERSPLLTTTFLFLVATTVFYCGLGSAAATDVDTVVVSCNAIRKFMDFDFCVSRLRSVPGSMSSDMNGHFLMAMDLATVSAAMAWDTATRMAREEVSDPAMRDALEACGYLYWASAMPALRMRRGYEAVQNHWAASSLSWIVDQVGIGCDAALKEGEGSARTRKMVEANHEFIQLSTMAQLILDSPARGS